MKNLKLNVLRLSVFAALLLSANLLKAQTSVYVCMKNGAYGYCYGNEKVMTCAYNKCVEAGGTSPAEITTNPGKGYGAIAVGKSSDGAQVVGAAAGYKNQEDANNAAISQCKNRFGEHVSITDTWHDQ